MGGIKFGYQPNKEHLNILYTYLNNSYFYNYNHLIEHTKIILLFID